MPQLARDIRDLPPKEREEALKSDRLACGEKVNGVRGIMHIRPEGIRITSRNRCAGTHLLNELTDNLPHLCRLDLSPWEGSIFDGELYLQDEFISLETKTNALEATAALLHCASDKAKNLQDLNGKIRYHVFDVIRARGEDLTTLPFKERLNFLQEFETLTQARGFLENIEFEELVTKDKEEYLRKIIESGGEGIVLKDLNAPYYLGARSKSWLKVKRNSTLDAIISGYDRGKEWDKKGLIGSIELGVFDEKGELRSIGRVSSFPLQKRIEMTEIVNGSPSLKREFIGTVVECTFQDLNKNLKGRHLQVIGFRDGVNSKPISECRFDFSNGKEKLIRAGMPIPDSFPNPNFLTAYLQNP
jgi:ATP-dependent DNA ligase